MSNHTLDPYVAEDLSNRLNQTIRDLNELHNLVLACPSSLVRPVEHSLENVRHQPLERLLNDPVLDTMYSRGYSDGKKCNEQMQTIQSGQLISLNEQSLVVKSFKTSKNDRPKDVTNTLKVANPKTRTLHCGPLSDQDFYGTYTS